MSALSISPFSCRTSLTASTSCPSSPSKEQSSTSGSFESITFSAQPHLDHPSMQLSKMEALANSLFEKLSAIPFQFNAVCGRIKECSAKLKSGNLHSATHVKRAFKKELGKIQDVYEESITNLQTLQKWLQSDPFPSGSLKTYKRQMTRLSSLFTNSQALLEPAKKALMESETCIESFAKIIRDQEWA